MQTQEFLEAVLPPKGLYVVIAISKRSHPRQYFHTDLASMSERIEALDSGDADVYFAIGSYRDKAGGRKQNNVVELKCFTMDIDCGPGKSYAAQKDGLTALLAFCSATGFPTPSSLVSSGYGVHVYWALDTPIPPTVWEAYSHNLSDLAKAKGLLIDRARTIDSASILRPPGTHNKKRAPDLTTVRVLKSEGEYPLTAFAMLAAAPSMTVVKRSQSTLAAALEIHTDHPPAEAGRVVQNCAALRFVSDKGGDVPEPLWYAALGIAAYCTQPDETAISWSRGHPEYSRADTLGKMAKWVASATGPATCAKFEDDLPDICHKCKLRGLITTPVQAGYTYKELTPPPQVEHAPTNAPIVAPPGFKRTTNGIVCRRENIDIVICPYDIYLVDSRWDDRDSREQVTVRWSRPHSGMCDFKLHKSALAIGAKDFASALANNGVLLKSKEATEAMQLYLRKFAQQLEAKQALIQCYDSYGWKANRTKFVLGQDVMERLADGTVKTSRATLATRASLSSRDARIVNTPIHSAGSATDWIKLTQMLDRPHMRGHGWMLGLAWASPLLTFLGIGGVMVNMVGDTGRGKTSALRWIGSVYGPTHQDGTDSGSVMITASSTDSALINRFGVYKNLPVPVDEITQIQADKLSDYIYQISEGRGKSRSNIDGSERAVQTWSTIVATASNRSVMEHVSATRGHNDAVMARVMEFDFPLNPFFADGKNGKQLGWFFDKNYGHAGKVYAEELVRLGPEELERRVKEASDTFSKRYNFKFLGHERFWESAIVTTEVGSQIAFDLGLIKYDFRLCILWVLDQIHIMRGTVADSAITANEAVSRYLLGHLDSTAVINHYEGKNVHMRQPGPRNELHARVDVHYGKGTAIQAVQLYMDRTNFKRWLHQHGMELRVVVNQLHEEGAMLPVAGDRLTLAKGTGLVGGQVYVVGIDLLNASMRTVVDDIETHKPLTLVTNKA